MSISYGENLRLSIFGESHSAELGMTLEGVPAGNKIDMVELRAFLERRAPGRNEFSTPRQEADIPVFVSGLCDDTTCGAPITAIIKNTDVRSQDYSHLKNIPRPGHADFTAGVKYGGKYDCAGGGQFSGRMTAPLCIAGGILCQLIGREGIKIDSRIVSIGGQTDQARMFELIAMKKAEGDSLGGVIECTVSGLPVGLGGPMFEGMESRISATAFGIPAVKGIEFGAGFAAADMCGSENNDAFCIRDGRVQTETNNCGGILGGITNGMPLVFRVAIKPTPSIARPQKSVNLETMEETELSIVGRHDPCIVPRALPVVESVAAIAIYDAMLGRSDEI